MVCSLLLCHLTVTLQLYFSPLLSLPLPSPLLSSPFSLHSFLPLFFPFPSLSPSFPISLFVYLILFLVCVSLSLFLWLIGNNNTLTVWWESNGGRVMYIRNSALVRGTVLFPPFLFTSPLFSQPLLMQSFYTIPHHKERQSLSFQAPNASWQVFLGRACCPSGNPIRAKPPG